MINQVDPPADFGLVGGRLADEFVGFVPVRIGVLQIRHGTVFPR